MATAKLCMGRFLDLYQGRTEGEDGCEEALAGGWGCYTINVDETISFFVRYMATMMGARPAQH
jgi:hypothetical protein